MRNVRLRHMVGDELRALAQRSAQAARDTAGLIEESIANVDAGHERVGRVSHAMEEIADSASQVRSRIDQVSVASVNDRAALIGGRSARVEAPASRAGRRPRLVGAASSRTRRAA